MKITYSGISATARAALLRAGRDAVGAPVTTFLDPQGGWPLRCCLTDSRPGDELAIVAFSPFTWWGPYREVGPIVIHAGACPGHDGRYPVQFDSRDQVVRAFGHADGRRHTQVYDRNALVRAGEGLRGAIETALRDPRVEEVHVHNVVSQCYSFTATRA